MPNIDKPKKKKPVLKPKQKTHLPTKTTPKKNTAAYYHCLAQQSQKGLKPSLTKCCHDCKRNSQALAKSRQQEINKIKNSWKQIGVSLGKIIGN